MRFHKLLRLIPALAVLLLCGCAVLQHGGPAAPQTLTILHTNDHHGRFWKSSKGEYGLAARKTVVDRVRAEAAAMCCCSMPGTSTPACPNPTC